MSPRKKLSDIKQFSVLYSSARRCCLCFSLNQGYSEKKGQIAHLDQNRSNYSVENLAWLCLPHHDVYDSKSSQSKAYSEFEVKQYRQALYDEVNCRRLISVGNDTVEKVRFKRQLIEDNLALFFFAAHAMYEPPFRDLLLKEVKDPDFREQIESAWMFLSTPASEGSLAESEEQRVQSRLNKMAAYIASSNNGKEDLRILMALAGTAINSMNESERNDPLFTLHDDTIRSGLMLLRKIHEDKRRSEAQG